MNLEAWVHVWKKNWEKNGIKFPQSQIWKIQNGIVWNLPILQWTPKIHDIFLFPFSLHWHWHFLLNWKDIKSNKHNFNVKHIRYVNSHKTYWTSEYFRNFMFFFSLLFFHLVPVSLDPSAINLNSNKKKIKLLERRLVSSSWNIYCDSKFLYRLCPECLEVVEKLKVCILSFFYNTYLH